jgi:hypothetical protein
MRLNHILTIFVFLILFLLSNQTFGQDTTQIKKNVEEKSINSKIGSLFKKDKILDFKITTNINALIKDRGEKSSLHSGILTIADKDKIDRDLTIQLQTRGHFRNAFENCSFPPLWLDFEDKDKNKTIFKSQDKLKMVTHCIKKDLVVREYLVYQLFETISDYHYKTRLCNVTYIDSMKNRDTETRTAFLIESDEDFGLRNNMVEIEKSRISQAAIDTMNMATVSVFEFLIGNTDWSVPGHHNIKTFVKNAKRAHAIPYDFDHSGIVDAPYAKPHPVLGLSSVEERMYRGIEYPDAIFNRVFNIYNSKKTAIYDLYKNNTLIDEAYKKFVFKYLDEFYKKLEKPVNLIKEIRSTAMYSDKK